MTTRRGFKVRCPSCGEEDTITVSVADVGELHCSQCDNDLTADDVREVIGAWQVLLQWLGTAPVRED